MGYHASASRPERRSAGGLSPPIHIGGCGFWTGCGANRTLLNDTNSPSNSGSSLAHNSLKAFRYSSLTAPRLSNGGAPNASNSSLIHPTPQPAIKRPPDSTSIDAKTFAVWTGFRWGSTNTVVSSLIFDVAAARIRNDRQLLQALTRVGARKFAGEAVRVAGPDVFRDDDVVAHANEVEPHLLAVPGNRYEGVGGGERAPCGDAETVFHVLTFYSLLRACLISPTVTWCLISPTVTLSTPCHPEPPCHPERSRRVWVRGVGQTTWQA